jgi:hypothetical protein
MALPSLMTRPSTCTSHALGGAAKFLPWLLDRTTAEQAQAVLYRTPPPVRLIYRRVWQPRFTPHHRWEPATR